MILTFIIILLPSIVFVFTLLAAIRETVQNGSKNVYYGFAAAVSLAALVFLSRIL